MYAVRLVDRGEHDEAADALTAHWGRTVARLGELVDTAALPRLVAERDGEIAGVLSFDVRDGMEVVTLDAAHDGQGAGRALMGAAVDRAHELGCVRLWLVTTNDNTRAIRFYQRLGMELIDVSIGGIDDARARLKPTIPLTGFDGIPMRHELVFELRLT
jgi:ribosomal protein S18 acetylase RimI-like enzyme